jgi:hypothetical protein
VTVAAAFPDRGSGAEMTPLVIAPFILFTPLAVRADRVPVYMEWLKVSERRQAGGAPQGTGLDACRCCRRFGGPFTVWW